MNNIKKYLKKFKTYLTTKNSAIALGVVFSCLIYKKYSK